MALPEWNKVFTWSDGPDLGLIHWAGTDGRNIYFLWRPFVIGTAGNYTVYRYDVLAQTVTEMISRDTLEAAGFYYEFYNNMYSVDLFRGALFLTLYYDAVIGGGLDEPHFAIFYIPSPGRFYRVYDVDITGESFYEPRIFANDDYIAIIRGAMGGLHSNSGLAWAASSGVIPVRCWNYGLDFDHQGIYINNFGGTTWKFTAGSWAVHFTTGGVDGYELWNIGPTRFWTREDIGTYTEDYSTFYHPSAQDVVAIGRNLPYHVALKTDFRTFARVTGTTTITNDSELEGTDTISSIFDKRPRMIRLNNGSVYMLCMSAGATGSYPKWSFWRRSEDYASTPNANGGPSVSGLHTAFADFSNLRTEQLLNHVRELNQFGATPYQRNFQISATDASIYLGNQIGADNQQVGRLQPPYIGTSSSLDDDEDLTDSISSDDVLGVDLTDAM